MAGNVHSATDCKFEPKAYSLLPDEPTSCNAAAPVAPNTIPNTMPNMVLPQVPTVNPNALPVAQPVYPLHHPFPLGMGGYSFPVARPVGLPVFFPNFFPNVQGNVPMNVPVNVSVNAPAPGQFAPAPAAGFRFDPEDDMPSKKKGATVTATALHCTYRKVYSVFSTVFCLSCCLLLV